jgi:hypothetical protein
MVPRAGIRQVSLVERNVILVLQSRANLFGLCGSVRCFRRVSASATVAPSGSVLNPATPATPAPIFPSKSTQRFLEQASVRIPSPPDSARNLRNGRFGVTQRKPLRGFPSRWPAFISGRLRYRYVIKKRLGEAFRLNDNCKMHTPAFVCSMSPIWLASSPSAISWVGARMQNRRAHSLAETEN